MRTQLLGLIALFALACASMREAPRAARRPRVEAPESTAMLDSQRVPIGDSPTQGPADALVTIVVFSDFECEYCGRVEPTLRALRRRYPNDVRLVWKNYPMSRHRFAMGAAQAAISAHAQGRFWEFHDALFAHADALEPAQLESYANELQLDVTAIRAAMEDPRTRERVRQDMTLARELGLDGTPFAMVNGTTVSGAKPESEWVSLIEEILVRARTIRPRIEVYARMTENPVPSRDPVRPPRRPRLDPSTVYAVPIEGAPAIGAEDALVTIVEFSDFQCEYCKEAVPTLAELGRRYQSDIRFVFRHLPLSFHDNARPAAELAIEAYRQLGNRGFWEMHDRFFQDQLALDRSSLEAHARALHLALPRVRAALDQHTHEPVIVADEALARQFGASGTPHFFVNGRRVGGAFPIERFAPVVDQALAEARALVASGVPRAQVYARLTANGATAPVYLPQPSRLRP